jgi:hypothetical protein
MSVLTPARAARVVARSKLHFDAVHDTRAYRGERRQPLPAVLQLLVAAFACGKMVLRATEDFSRDIPKSIASKMGLRGTVSDTAQYELLCRTSPDGLREALWRQVRADVDAKAVTNDVFVGGAVSYDGKGAGSGWGEAPNDACRESVCDAEGTAFWDLFALRACLVSSSARPVLDQELIPSKKGEATTFPAMFERDVRRFPKLFRYVLGDAGLASASNAQHVLNHSKVYVWQIKANFKRLFPLALEVLACARVVATTSERYQGTEVRRELRRVAVPEGVSFPGATQLLGIRQIRTHSDGSVETEDRVYITAIPWQELTPTALLRLVRLHWGIENGANWTADMILQEDTRRPCNQGFGPNVCSWLILLAYNIVSVFRAHLPDKDGKPQRWERARELIYQAFLGLATAAGRQAKLVNLA